MNIFDKTKNAFNKAKKAFNTKGYSGFLETRLFQSNDFNTGDYLEINDVSLYTNKAVKKRGEKVGETQWFLKKGDEIIEDESNEWLKLLKQPNEFFSGQEFWELHQRYLDLTGSAFIWKMNEGENGIPEALHLLRPDQVEIVVKDGKIQNYKYNHGNGTTNYDPEEIIHSRHPDPKKPLFGESILRAGQKEIDTEVQISEYQNNLIKNGGKVEGVFKFKNSQLTKEQLEELRSDYQEKYGKAKRAGMPLFLGGDASYENVGLTPSELGYEEAKKMSLNDIVIMTGVPKSILASVEGVKFDNAEQAERGFMKHTIVPLIKKMKNKLNRELLPEEFELDFIDPTPEDTEEKLSTLETANKINALTINEKREALGYEPIDDEEADQIYIPMNMFPISQPNPRGKSEKKSM